MRKKRSPIWKLDKKRLENVVRKAESLSEILRHFGFNHQGGYVGTLKRRLEHDGIDFSHIPQGRGSNKIRYRGGSKPVPLSKLLKKGVQTSRYWLKRKLIRAGLLKNRCDICRLGPRWREKSLVMILDPINGVRDDGRIQNLRLVCPNCNSQLPTHCGRNQKAPVV